MNSDRAYLNDPLRFLFPILPGTFQGRRWKGSANEGQKIAVPEMPGPSAKAE